MGGEGRLRCRPFLAQRFELAAPALPGMLAIAETGAPRNRLIESSTVFLIPRAGECDCVPAHCAVLSRIAATGSAIQACSRLSRMWPHPAFRAVLYGCPYRVWRRAVTGVASVGLACPSISHWRSEFCAPEGIQVDAVLWCSGMVFWRCR